MSNATGLRVYFRSNLGGTLHSASWPKPNIRVTRGKVAGDIAGAYTRSIDNLAFISRTLAPISFATFAHWDSKRCS